MPPVRPANPADAQAIADIHIRCWQWAYADLMPAEHLAELERTRAQRIDRWRESLARDDAGTFVALGDAGEVTGFSSAGLYRPQEDHSVRIEGVGEIYSIYVDPSMVGTGAGRAAMDGAVDWLDSRGLRPVHLWVLEGNARARRFYERYGFALDGDRAMFTVGSVDLAEVRYTLDRPA
jgi:RimJ/RimL family protein N-acetyltransferase